MQIAAQEVARLGNPTPDRLANLACQWIGIAALVARLMPQEGDEIARGGEADGEDLGALRGEGQGIGIARIEAAFEAELGKIGLAREWRDAAVAKGPVVT